MRDGVMKSILAVLAVKNSGECKILRCEYLACRSEVVYIGTVDLMIKVPWHLRSLSLSKKEFM